MNLVPSDPFRDIDTLFNRLSRAGVPGNTLPADAYRRGNDVWVHIDVPGVGTDSLDISVERGVLTVSAQRNWQRAEGDRVYFSERQSGAFKRQVQLGEGLDLENIEADLHDGVLTLRIPVAQTAQPRKISVKSESPAIEANAS